MGQKIREYLVGVGVLLSILGVFSTSARANFTITSQNVYNLGHVQSKYPYLPNEYLNFKYALLYTRVSLLSDITIMQEVMNLADPDQMTTPPTAGGIYATAYPALAATTAARALDLLPAGAAVQNWPAASLIGTAGYQEVYATLYDTARITIDCNFSSADLELNPHPNYLLVPGTNLIPPGAMTMIRPPHILRVRSMGAPAGTHTWIVNFHASFSKRVAQDKREAGYVVRVVQRLSQGHIPAANCGAAAAAAPHNRIIVMGDWNLPRTVNAAQLAMPGYMRGASAFQTFVNATEFATANLVNIEPVTLTSINDMGAQAHSYDHFMWYGPGFAGLAAPTVVALTPASYGITAGDPLPAGITTAGGAAVIPNAHLFYRQVFSDHLGITITVPE
jgi:hypothetical protein